MKSNNTMFLSLLPIVLLLVSITGCDRYRVTLNERLISEPRGVLSSVDVADEALKACIEQTVADQQIHTTDQLGTLVCTHAGITSLDGIQVFSKLQTVNLAHNALNSLSPLLFLGELTSVNLTGNKGLDCSELKPLKEHLPENGTLVTPEQCTTNP